MSYYRPSLKCQDDSREGCKSVTVQGLGRFVFMDLQQGGSKYRVIVADSMIEPGGLMEPGARLLPKVLIALHNDASSVRNPVLASFNGVPCLNSAHQRAN